MSHVYFSDICFYHIFLFREMEILTLSQLLDFNVQSTQQDHLRTNHIEKYFTPTHLASACNSYNCPLSRGYACAWSLAVRALCSLLHVLSLSSVKCDLLHKNKLNWIIFMWFVFLFVGRCEVSGDLLSFLVSFANVIVTSTSQRQWRTDRLAVPARVLTGHVKSDETQGILKSMQTMIGTLV